MSVTGAIGEKTGPSPAATSLSIYDFAKADINRIKKDLSGITSGKENNVESKKIVQEALIILGFLDPKIPGLLDTTGKLTGKWGPKSKDALKEFRKAAGLSEGDGGTITANDIKALGVALGMLGDKKGADAKTFLTSTKKEEFQTKVKEETEKDEKKKEETKAPLVAAPESGYEVPEENEYKFDLLTLQYIRVKGAVLKELQDDGKAYVMSDGAGGVNISTEEKKSDGAIEINLNDGLNENEITALGLRRNKKLLDLMKRRMIVGGDKGSETDLERADLKAFVETINAYAEAVGIDSEEAAEFYLEGEHFSMKTIAEIKEAGASNVKTAYSHFNNRTGPGLTEKVKIMDWLNGINNEKIRKFIEELLKKDYGVKDLQNGELEYEKLLKIGERIGALSMIASLSEELQKKYFELIGITFPGKLEPPKEWKKEDIARWIKEKESKEEKKAEESGSTEEATQKVEDLQEKMQKLQQNITDNEEIENNKKLITEIQGEIDSLPLKSPIDVWKAVIAFRFQLAGQILKNDNKYDEAKQYIEETIKVITEEFVQKTKYADADKKALKDSIIPAIEGIANGIDDNEKKLIFINDMIANTSIKDLDADKKLAKLYIATVIDSANSKTKPSEQISQYEKLKEEPYASIIKGEETLKNALKAALESLIKKDTVKKDTSLMSRVKSLYKSIIGEDLKTEAEVKEETVKKEEKENPWKDEIAAIKGDDSNPTIPNNISTRMTSLVTKLKDENVTLNDAQAQEIIDAIPQNCKAMAKQFLETTRNSTNDPSGNPITGDPNNNILENFNCIIYKF